MNGNTLLLRHVHPTFEQNGRATRRVFSPTKKDNGKLSVYDGDQISVQDCKTHYCETQKLDSCGVVAVTVDDCKNLNLQAYPDPIPFKEHALIDFSSLSSNQQRKAASKLSIIASERGWLS